MRVIQLGPFAGPRGGVQTHVRAVRRLLLEHGIPCDTINLTRFRDSESVDVYYPHNATEVLFLLLRRRGDVLHLHLGGKLTPRELALCALCCVMPSFRKVLTFHSGGYPFSAQGAAARRWSLAGAIFRRFDAIIAVNESIKRVFEGFGVDANRIHVIAPHAVFAPADGPLPAPLQAFFDSHRPALLTVAQLEPEYDLFLQLDVFTRLRQRFPNAGLAIMGEGSLRDALVTAISRHAYGSDVLLCGDVEHEVAERAIARADALLRTTLYDGDSIAVREALHFGTPVIATDNGMRPDGVHLIPCSDGGSLYDAVEAIVERPPARSKRFDPDTRNIEALVNIYRLLLSPKEARNITRADVSPRV